MKYLNQLRQFISLPMEGAIKSKKLRLHCYSKTLDIIKLSIFYELFLDQLGGAGNSNSFVSRSFYNRRRINNGASGLGPMRF